MSLLKVNEIQIFNGETVTITAPTVVTANDNSNAALRITQTGTGNALVVEDDNGNPDSTPFVVDSTGRLILGATSAFSVSGGSPQLQNHSTGPSGSIISTTRWVNGGASGGFVLAHSRGAEAGTHASLNNGDDFGEITFQGSDGTSFITGASILAEVDGTPGTNDMPGRLVFSTTADNASSPTERMRIDSSGNVGIGTSSPAQKLDVTGNINATGALTLGTALAIAEGGTGATDAATARTNLDVDQAGTDNSTDVTLVTTSHDYLSIAGQAITLGPIDLAADVTGSLPYASISGTPTLAAVATSGAYSDLSGTPTLGTAAAEDVGYFATAAQGALADSAVQPGDDADTLGSGAAADGYVLTADGAGGAAWEAASGGGASLPIDLLSSGASIRKSDGTTAVLSESAGAVTLENVTNLEADSITDKAGTGAPDFPNGLTNNTSPVYSRSNILDTVSQSAGVPTGGIIERGSNANGEFVKYADGTMICTHGLNSASSAWNSNGSIYQTGSATWTFPATFASSDIVATGQANSVTLQTAFGIATTTSVDFRVIAGLNVGVLPRGCRVQAVGRWF